MIGASVGWLSRFRFTRRRWPIQLPLWRPRFRHGDHQHEQGDHGDGGESEEGRVIAKCRDDEAGRAQACRAANSLNRAESAPSKAVTAGAPHHIGQQQRQKRVIHARAHTIEQLDAKQPRGVVR